MTRFTLGEGTGFGDTSRIAGSEKERKETAMHIIPLEEAGVTKIKSRETEGVSRNFIGAALTRGGGPQAYIAELAPGSRIPSHFHDVDQFQVFVKGRGRIGKDSWQAGTFHYADAFTPYGPLVPDPGSEMFYFALRASAASGVFRTRDSRELIGNYRGRNIVSTVETGARDSARGGVREETLMALPEDGVRGEGVHIAAGAKLVDEAPSETSQFAIVLSGVVNVSQKRLGPLSLIYVDSGERMPDLVAVDGTAEVLRLWFGKASERPGSDPTELAKRNMTVGYTLPDDY